MQKKQTNSQSATRLSHALALKAAGPIVDNALARSAAKPEAFADSFTTLDAGFSVEVKDPWGEVTEDIEVKIDCGGMIHGDEDLIDVLIEMLEKAKENLIARRGPLTRKRLDAL
jgi:hypothetical protein